MRTEAKAFIIIAAMAGLVTGCATAPKKECKRCEMNSKSGKDSCGAKSSCTSKATCRAKGNCDAKGS